MLAYFFHDSHYSIFFQYSPQFVLSVLDISAETSNTYSYLTGLISLSAMCLRPINVAACFLILVFMQLSGLPLYIPPLLYLSVTRHLPHFQFGALMNKAAVNIYMKSLWRHMLSFSFLVHTQKRNRWVIWYMH